MSAFDTGPSLVAGLKVQLTTRTTLPAGCSTVIVALVNARSRMFSLQPGLGQSGAPGIDDGGAVVVTLNGVLPFLISDAGIETLPVTLIGAGFCPGTLLWSPGLVQFAVTSAVASIVTRTSPLPSPANSPEAVKLSPLSTKEGAAFLPPFRWTFPADTVATSPRATSTVMRTAAILDTCFLLLTENAHCGAFPSGCEPTGAFTERRRGADSPLS